MLCHMKIEVPLLKFNLIFNIMAIHYFTEDIDMVKIPKRKISDWIKNCILSHGKFVGEINFIFCSDEYLKEMNVQYLKHNYYTDIITFNYNEEDYISGDIFISIDRVTDNSEKFKVFFFEELLRVLIHGVLHLLGFEDGTVQLKDNMHRNEDIWLKNYKSIN